MWHSVFLSVPCVKKEGLIMLWFAWIKWLELDACLCFFTYNSLIKCLCQEGLFEDAESLIDIMQVRGVDPEQATYLIMVNEHCKRSDWVSAFDILDQMEERGLRPYVAIYDTIIRCLSREKNL